MNPSIKQKKMGDFLTSQKLRENESAKSFMEVAHDSKGRMHNTHNARVYLYIVNVQQCQE